MGKATIISEQGAGLYTVRLEYDAAKASAMVAQLAAAIAILDAQIPLMETSAEKSAYRLRRASLQQKKDYLNSYGGIVGETVSAWCADYTTGLTGEVATAEINGIADTVQILPGGPAYVAATHGQLTKAAACNPHQWLYNLMLHPGWQKWKPTYRHGTLTSVDKVANTGNVSLASATAKNFGLNINQTTSLSSVPIEYMGSGAAAFEVGDDVLVKFQAQSWTDPKIIGFAHDPKLGVWEPWGGDLCKNHTWSFPEIRQTEMGVPPVVADPIYWMDVDIIGWHLSEMYCRWGATYPTFDDPYPAGWGVPLSAADKPFDGCLINNSKVVIDVAEMDLPLGVTVYGYLRFFAEGCSSSSRQVRFEYLGEGQHTFYPADYFTGGYSGYQTAAFNMIGLIWAFYNTCQASIKINSIDISQI